MDAKCKACKFRLATLFKKPTVEQCEAYAKEIGFTTFDADYFWWKLESTGWVNNRGLPYKSWKGIIQTWFKGAVRRGQETGKPTKTFKEKYEEHKG